jgi:Glycosyl hydrolase family 45
MRWLLLLCGFMAVAADRRCGWSWHHADATCQNACPDNVNEQCHGGMTCWSDLSDAPCAGRRPLGAGMVTGLPFGTSTRYWDCAKPSCAWPGRTPWAVKACAFDGATVIYDANAASVVDGGHACACDDSQPYVSTGDPGLSYGTAAVSDESMCGRCFELTFTTEPVVGKRMVVKITNTGDDLQSGQFDIAIPGGGVGAMDGCTAQHGRWWGDRYGGVGEKGDCDALPCGLRRGCMWRFDWFADNPDHVYREVACGSEKQ